MLLRTGWLQPTKKCEIKYKKPTPWSDGDRTMRGRKRNVLHVITMRSEGHAEPQWVQSHPTVAKMNEAGAKWRSLRAAIHDRQRPDRGLQHELRPSATARD